MILLKYQKHAVICLLTTFFFGASSCRRADNLPAKGSKAYDEVVRAFHVGLAALQVGDDVRAEAKLSELSTLVPAEPAVWANWGLLALRQRNYDPSAERLERARSLAPENDQIYYLIGILEKGRGQSADAITALRRAIELNPKNLLSVFALAEEIERQAGENSEKEYQALIQQILSVQPDNLAALLELARIAAKRNDKELLRSTVEKITSHSAQWPAEVQQQLTALQTAVAGSDQQTVATRVAFLRNVLVRVPEYRRDLSMIKPQPGEEVQPLTQFLKMEPPTFTPASADTEINFSLEPLQKNGSDKWSWIGAFSLNGEGTPAIAVANQKELRINNRSYPFPGGTSETGPQPNGVVGLDFDYDFKTDLALVGAGGFRLLRQANANGFEDVTVQTKLPPTILNGSFTGGWAADIDADGDLDIVVGSQQGEPTVLRNNGDGSFVESHPFVSSSGLRDFVWADLDGDGDPDAAFIDAQFKLHVFANERNGQFQNWPLPPDFPIVLSICAADLNEDGILDLLTVHQDSGIVRLSGNSDDTNWESSEVVRLSPPNASLTGSLTLRAVDLDNNGANDLLLISRNAVLAQSEITGGQQILNGATFWLEDQDGEFKDVWPENAFRLGFGVADVNGDGRLDLLGFSDSGEPVQAINHGSKNYHWQVIRPRAAQTTGDQRINSFGIGGEMEIRAGTLLQKQLITGPIVHFGLGEQTGADVVRIVWPNGTVRAEFETKADQPILAEQRLKGSCPFLFAFNGKEMKFVKDAVPWSSAIGLRINTLGTAKVEATEEWYKIGGDELAPRDGYYDFRITAELWETYYYDHLALMTVDHPVGTDIFVDERFVIPPAKLAITTVENPRKIAKATDDNGRDVTEVVSNLDEQYLDTFGRGRYQGVTRDHWVEVDLGEDAPQTGPLCLIAKGWMHPTDSSINVAISQGKEVRPTPLSLEVLNENGGWTVAHPNLGFPAGRKKITLIDLTGVFRPGLPRRLRLRTNLEIFWDSIEWARGIPETKLITTRLDPSTADLRYRGYSVITVRDGSSPEIPDYNELASSKQIWRDLIGYYTRFGDVRELLKKTDDRYVIMNAGDEMIFRFPAPPQPPEGFTRDFILIGDGWIKDGDYNSTFAKTVLPLPYHAKSEYVQRPGRLEDEFVYRQYPDDWQKYHTRYVTTDVFRNALRSNKP